MKTLIVNVPHMSVRLKKVLLGHGVAFIEDIFEYTDDDYMKVRNIGRKNIAEAHSIVSEYKNK